MRSSPPTFRPAVPVWIAGALLAAAAAAAIGTGLDGRPWAPGFFEENGPIEMVECLFLAVAVVPFALATHRLTRGQAIMCGGIVMIIAFMIVRETPRCGSIYSTADLCLPPAGKTILQAAIVACFVLCLLAKRFRPNVASLGGIVGEFAWIWPIGCVMLLLVAAQVAEDRHRIAIEEMLELAAYFYLGLLGCWAFRHAPELDAVGRPPSGYGRPC